MIYLITVLANNTVLSNFASTGQASLLFELYREVYVAYAVYEELQQGLADGYSFLQSLEPYIYPHHADGWLKLVMLTGETELRYYQTMPATFKNLGSKIVNQLYTGFFLFSLWLFNHKQSYSTSNSFLIN